MRTLPTYLFDQNQIQGCHAEMIEVLRSHFDALTQLKAVSGKRKAFANHLNLMIKRGSEVEESNFKILGTVLAGQEGVPDKSNYEIDLRIVCQEKCGSKHAVNVELCIQNREAIGTNFLKLEVFAKLNPEIEHIGVLLCPDRRYFKESNMDAAYGDDDEYIVAHQLSYHTVMSSKMLILTLGD